jgi:hypothetical protein
MSNASLSLKSFDEFKSQSTASEANASASTPPPLRDALTHSDSYPHVRVVRDLNNLIKIGKLRHSVFITMQNKRYTSCVSEPECLLEYADFSGVNLYTVADGEITAAMRANPIRDMNVSAAEIFLDVARTASLDLDRTMSCTRLIRSPNYRGSHAGDIVRYVRDVTTKLGYRYCVAHSVERMLPYWRRYDFRPVGLVVESPAAGPLHYLILDTKFLPARRLAS